MQYFRTLQIIIIRDSVLSLSSNVLNDGIHYARLRIEESLEERLGNGIPCEM